MLNQKLTLINSALLLLVINISQAQTPGGAGTTGLNLWLKSNAGVTSSGGNISQWSSQSGTYTTQPSKTASSNVTLVSNVFNFNQGIRFDGTSGQTLAGTASTTFSGIADIFVVAKDNGTTSVYAGTFATRTNSGGQGIIFDGTTDRFFMDGSGADPLGNNTALIATTSASTAHIITGKYGNSGNNTNNSSISIDGGTVTTFSGTGVTVNSNTGVEIGGRTSGSQPARVLNGDIAEIVYYSSASGMSTAAVSQIRSYLAVKYGITLNTGVATNYASSSAATIWTGNATYQNDVFGVGIDNGSGLSQLKSNSVNTGSGDGTGQSADGNIVLDASSAISATGNFLMIGHTTGALSNQVTDLPTGIGARLARVWRAQETGTGVGTVSLSFDMTGLSIGSSPYNLRLLVNSTTTFATGTTTVSPSSVSGNIVTFNVDFTANATRYFTFGNVTLYPGNVSAPALWLKANANTSSTTQGASVSSWVDNVAAYNFTNATTSQQPLYSNIVGDNVNYNPSLRFSAASSRYLRSATTWAGNTFVDVNFLGNSTGSVLGIGSLTATSSGGTNFATHWIGNGSPYIFGIGFYGNTMFAGVPHTGSVNVGVVNLGYANLMEADRPTGTTALAYTLTERVNGKVFSTAVNAYASPTTPAYLNIGAGNGAAGSSSPYSAYWNGGIEELITYKTRLTGSNVIKVQSYLAIKYGITLDSTGMASDLASQAAYLNTAGTSIYVGDGAGSRYWNYIMGIGRDDAEGLLQKQSHQQDDSVRLYLGSSIAANNISNSNTFATNNHYVMMGSNTGKLCSDAATATEMPAVLLSTGASRVDREWKVMTTNYTGDFNIDVTLSCVVARPDQLVLLVDDDGNFTNAQILDQSAITMTYNTSSKTVTINDLNTSLLNNGTSSAALTRYITLATTTFQILPVNLLAFTATPEKTSVLLNWTTASEINSSYFEVQRSPNAGDWQPVTKIAARGNSSTQASYRTADMNPMEGISYYRLKQVDKDGRFAYSQTRKVSFHNIDAVYKIYPNPVKDKAIIAWQGGLQNKPHQVSVYDVNGVKLEVAYSINDNTAILQLAGLPAAAYVIKLESAKQTVQKMLIKQ